MWFEVDNTVLISFDYAAAELSKAIMISKNSLSVRIKFVRSNVNKKMDPELLRKLT